MRRLAKTNNKTKEKDKEQGNRDRSKGAKEEFALLAGWTPGTDQDC